MGAQQSAACVLPTCWHLVLGEGPKEVRASYRARKAGLPVESVQGEGGLGQDRILAILEAGGMY